MNAKDFNRCLQLIKNGNNRGMEEIYNHYYEKLKATAHYHGYNRESAEDIASNVLISIFKNAANYNYVKDPNAWMYSAEKNAEINFRKNNEKYVYPEFMEETFPARSADPDAKLDLKGYLEKLDAREQDIVLLHYVYGLKIKDTAKMLQISVSTVNRQLDTLRGELKIFL